MKLLLMILWLTMPVMMVPMQPIPSGVGGNPFADELPAGAGGAEGE